ncbi:hypothetical protein IB238_00370 [Rhizobium sp. ARZ01]|nr:hypothetical protein [Rhizobium sp. ARZ01]MBD9371091.1 hypothetical protein [Rhizobium sp. ARZ01]
MPARILLLFIVLMIGSILSILVLQRASSAGAPPSEGQLLSTPSRMVHEQ